MKQAVEKLTDRGVIVLDDSQREKYREGLEYVRKKAFSTLDFSGLVPLDFSTVTTTVIYKPGNCLGI